MLRAKHIMTKEIVSINADKTLADAYELMRDYDIKHLIVLDQDRLSGILSESDIFLRSLPAEEKLIIPAKKVGDVMTKNVITCLPSSSLGDVAATMIACKIGSLPVVFNDNVIGIISKTDLLDIFCQKEAVAKRVTSYPIQADTPPHYAYAT